MISRVLWDHSLCWQGQSQGPIPGSVMRSTPSNVRILCSKSNAMFHTFFISKTRAVFSHPEINGQLKSPGQRPYGRLQWKRMYRYGNYWREAFCVLFYEGVVAANYVSLVTAGSVGGAILTGRDRRTRSKTCLNPTFPLHISCELAWDWTQAPRRQTNRLISHGTPC